MSWMLCNSITRSEFKGSYTMALVDADDAHKNPSVETDRGSKRRRSGKEPASTSAPSETTTTTAGKTTTTGSKTHKQSASQSAPVEETMQTTNGFEAPAHQEFETGSPCRTERRGKKKKVTNLNVEERIAFNVSLRMFTRSVVIQRRVEDLQLGVESYQKKLNLTKPDTIDAHCGIHKFNDGTLDDVWTALNDRLKGIRMEYLPQTFWSQRDKANARAMIQAIDKRLKTRRIMRSLERFVGGSHIRGFNTTAGNPVKNILLKLNLSDHSFIITVLADYLKCGGVPDSSWLTRILSHMLIRPDNIRHHVISSRYEHVGPEVASSQDGKVTRWRRDCAWLMISRCSRSQCQIQVQGTSSIQEVNDHYNIFTRESQEYELKTKDKASYA
ncbi:hypothetical protein Tco_1174045 [Tanacetum coccineum]